MPHSHFPPKREVFQVKFLFQAVIDKNKEKTSADGTPPRRRSGARRRGTRRSLICGNSRSQSLSFKTRIISFLYASTPG
jgi:hypothetical protein